MFAHPFVLSLSEEHVDGENEVQRPLVCLLLLNNQRLKYGYQ